MKYMLVREEVKTIQRIMAFLKCRQIPLHSLPNATNPVPFPGFITDSVTFTFREQGNGLELKGKSYSDSTWRRRERGDDRHFSHSFPSSVKYLYYSLCHLDSLDLDQDLFSSPLLPKLSCILPLLLITLLFLSSFTTA